MRWLMNAINDWVRGLLIDANMSAFANMFGNVNSSVQDVAYQAGQTPQGWNASIFSMVRNLSETVILPVAGIILTFVLCYELIQLIIEKNNMHEFDTFNIFKWIFKTFIAVFILTNTWNIVMGIFDLAQGVVNQSAGIITGNLGLGIPAMMAQIEAQLQGMSVGQLIGLFFQVQIVGFLMEIMAVVITIIVWGRMIEIYLVTSVAPIPLSTMVNREWGQMGNNYLKSLFALAFQGFLIMVCVAIYAVLVANFVIAGNMTTTIWNIVAYTALLCFMSLKSGELRNPYFQPINFIKGFSIRQGQNGMFIGMPSKADKSGEFRDTVYPITAEFRTQLNNAITEAYHLQVEKVQEQAKAHGSVEHKPKLADTLAVGKAKAAEQTTKNQSKTAEIDEPIAS